MDYKVSHYNLYYPSSRKGLYLVYNVLTEGVVLASHEGVAALSNDPEHIPLERKEALLRAGILVAAETDEYRIFQDNHDQTKYSQSACYIMVYTTYRCNLDCTYCYASFLGDTKIIDKPLDAETTQSIIEFIKQLWVTYNIQEFRLLFFGGEPMLNPAPIIQLLDDLTPWAMTNGVKLSSAVCTNGTIPLRPWLSHLMGHNTFFHFTLDGPQSIHDQRRPYKSGQGTYEDIFENIALVKTAGADYVIRVNIDRRNVDGVENLLTQVRDRLGEKVKIRFAEVIPPIPAGEDASHCPWSMQCLMGSEPDTMISLIRLARDMGMIVLTRPVRDWVFCEFLRQHSYIVDPFGDVYKCEGFAGVKDHRAGYLLKDGTLQKTIVFDDWVSHNPLETECRECVYLPACGGGCPCLVYEEKGTYHAGGCTMFKDMLQAFIGFYLETKYPGLMAENTKPVNRAL